MCVVYDMWYVCMVCISVWYIVCVIDTWGVCMCICLCLCVWSVRCVVCVLCICMCVVCVTYICVGVLYGRCGVCMCMHVSWVLNLGLEI